MQNSRDIAELQARRNALSICSSVVNAAAKLFVKAQSVEGMVCLLEISDVSTLYIFFNVNYKCIIDLLSSIMKIGVYRDQTHTDERGSSS